MAEFLEAIKTVLKHEGGYANVAGDRGGETYRGISRKFHPNWPGWKIIDAMKPLKHNQVINTVEMESAVKNFYFKNFWLPLLADRYDSQAVGTFMLDWFIHSGEPAIKRMQKVVGVVTDGKIGPVTLEAINAQDDALLPKLKTNRIAQLTALSKKPGQGKFLAGWLNRVNSF